MSFVASADRRRNRILFIATAAILIAATAALTAVLIYRWIDQQTCSDPVFLSFDGAWCVNRFVLDDGNWRTWKSQPRAWSRRAVHAVGPRAAAVLDPDADFAGLIFDLNFHRWRKVPPSLIAGSNRGAVQAEFIGNRLVVWGMTKGPTYGAVLDAKSRKWNPMSDAPITPRYRAACGVIGSKLYIWGGYGYYSGTSGNSGPVSDGAVFDVDLNEWELLPESPISMGYETRMRVWREKIILLDRSDVAIYDPSTRVWQRLPNAPFERCAMPAWSVVGDQILVWSGLDGERFTTVTARRAAAFDLIAHQWRELPESPIPPRCLAKTCVIDSTTFVWGGWNGDGDSLTDLAAFDTESGTWQVLPAMPKAIPKLLHPGW